MICKLSLLRTYILVVLLLNSLIGYSQITIDQSDMPSPGDTVRISTTINFDSYDFEETGEDFTWDYRDLVDISQRVDSFFAVTDTPLFYWPFFLFSANLAYPLLTASPIPELPLSDIYNFYNNNSDSYRDEGFAATLIGLPLPFKFDNPDIVYEFPMDYGNSDSSVSGLDFGLDNIGHILVKRHRKNTVDGWGTLITPYGIHEVLRLKSEVTEYDSIYIDSISIGIPITREFIEYKWLGKNQKVPLLTVSTSLLGLVVDYVDSLRSVATIIHPVAVNAQQVKIYPNPTSGLLNIDLGNIKTGKLEMFIYDGHGRLIFGKEFADISHPKISMNLSRYLSQSGTYYVELKGENLAVRQRFIYTK